MPLVKGSDHRAFPFDTFRIVALVSPTTGSKETCAWHISMAPGNPGQAHWVDHEQLFVVLAGSATADLGAEEHVLEAGDALDRPRRRDVQHRQPERRLVRDPLHHAGRRGGPYPRPGADGAAVGPLTADGRPSGPAAGTPGTGTPNTGDGAAIGAEFPPPPADLYDFYRRAPAGGAGLLRAVGRPVGGHPLRRRPDGPARRRAVREARERAAVDARPRGGTDRRADRHRADVRAQPARAHPRPPAHQPGVHGPAGQPHGAGDRGDGRRTADRDRTDRPGGHRRYLLFPAAGSDHLRHDGRAGGRSPSGRRRVEPGRTSSCSSPRSPRTGRWPAPRPTWRTGSTASSWSRIAAGTPDRIWSARCWPPRRRGRAADDGRDRLAVRGAGGGRPREHHPDAGQHVAAPAPGPPALGGPGDRSSRPGRRRGGRRRDAAVRVAAERAVVLRVARRRAGRRPHPQGRSGVRVVRRGQSRRDVLRRPRDLGTPTARAQRST